MLMIRLQRFGRKNNPMFRVVLTDKRNAPKSGKFLEILGFKNPKNKDKKLNADRIKYWISKGAQISPTIHNMLISEKIIEGRKINVVPRSARLKTELSSVPLPKKVEEKPKVEAEVKENKPAEADKEGVDNQSK
ncbi:MAG: 30S ribosomal protein S16 [Patescibacteria group bacterium]